MSCHIISYQIISYHIISYHIMTYYDILYYIILYYIIILLATHGAGRPHCLRFRRHRTGSRGGDPQLLPPPLVPLAWD